MFIQSLREKRLTWNDGPIPSQEVWIKIRGDKGGVSMKMSFQVCNVPHPNSAKNSCLCCLPSPRHSHQPPYCTPILQTTSKWPLWKAILEVSKDTLTK